MRKRPAVKKDEVQLLYEKQTTLEKRLYSATVANMSMGIIEQIQNEIAKVKMEIYDEIQRQDFKIITGGAPDGEVWTNEEGSVTRKKPNEDSYIAR